MSVSNFFRIWRLVDWSHGIEEYTETVWDQVLQFRRDLENTNDFGANMLSLIEDNVFNGPSTPHLFEALDQALFECKEPLDPSVVSAEVFTDRYYKLITDSYFTSDERFVLRRNQPLDMPTLLEGIVLTPSLQVCVTGGSDDMTFPFLITIDRCHDRSLLTDTHAYSDYDTTAEVCMLVQMMQCALRRQMEICSGHLCNYKCFGVLNINYPSILLAMAMVAPDKGGHHQFYISCLGVVDLHPLNKSRENNASLWNNYIIMARERGIHTDSFIKTALKPILPQRNFVPLRCDPHLTNLIIQHSQLTKQQYMIAQDDEKEVYFTTHNLNSYIIKIAKITDERTRRRAEREILIYERLDRSRQIAELIGYQSFEDRLIAVQRYHSTTYYEACVYSIDFEILCRKLMKAIAYVHSRGVIHCDIKPPNIRIEQIDYLFKVRIIDFDYALIADTDNLNVSHGTNRYLAPEASIRPYKMNFTSDVYSAALTLLNFLYPFVPHDETSLYSKFRNAENFEERRTTALALVDSLTDLAPRTKTRRAVYYRYNNDPPFRHLVPVFRSMLEMDPEKRPSAKEVESTLHKFYHN